MTTYLPERFESRFDPMMLESHFREELLARMARCNPTNDSQQEFEVKVLRILPQNIAAYIERIGDESRSSEIRTAILCQLAFQALEIGTVNEKQAAITVLQDAIPLDPHHPLFAASFNSLMRCMANQPSIRPSVSRLIEKLSSHLPV